MAVFIPSKFGGYQIEESQNSGVFRCTKMEAVRVKTVGDEYFYLAENEYKILKKIRKLDPDRNNLIKFYDRFRYNHQTCFAFELLDRRLFDFMRDRRGLHLSVFEIRLIAKQMLVALNALKSREIIHTDIKLENIVFVNHQLQPYKVKLVEFGLASLKSDFQVGASFHGRAYRPPEVILGQQVDEGIDMWALGCVLAELFIGQYMFYARSDYEILRNIVQLQGMPLQNFIRNGFYAEKYFTPPQASTGFVWQLKTPQEYYASVERQGWDFNSISNLISSFDDMPRLHKMAENPEDILVFMDLLKKMLEIDPMIRITPGEALQHDFFRQYNLRPERNDLFITPLHSTSSISQVETSTEIIPTQCGGYRIERCHNSGAFGKVFTCTKMDTQEVVAVKIVKEEYHNVAIKECKMLDKIRQLDPDRNNLIKFYECIRYNNQTCFAFELLDQNLYDFMRDRNTALSVSEIRTITEQMLVALDTLKSQEIIHTDIKPDNIMLVNHQLQPFKVKLIDFGLAAMKAELPVGAILQAPAYRSPEVILGLPVDEGIDMWALGCVLAELFTGQYMVAASSGYEVMRNIIKLQGMPPQDLIENGFYARKYFNLSQDSTGFVWQLKSPEEYYAGMVSQERDYNNICDSVRSLDDLPWLHEIDDDPMDTLAFIALLKKMLEIDPRNRITPGLHLMFLWRSVGVSSGVSGLPA